MTKHFVCHASYLRNHTSNDCHLWYTCTRWWFLWVFFSFFQNFDFPGFVRGSKMRKNCQSGSIPQEPYVIWFSFMLHMCKMISPVFLRFFEMLILGVSISLKVQKMAQNDKTLCLLDSISQEDMIYDHYMIAIFGTHVLNDDISRCYFHFVKVLIFWVVGRVKGQKMVKNDKHLQMLFSFFQNFDFLGC